MNVESKALYESQMTAMKAGLKTCSINKDEKSQDRNLGFDYAK